MSEPDGSTLRMALTAAMPPAELPTTMYLYLFMSYDCPVRNELSRSRTRNEVAVYLET